MYLRDRQQYTRSIKVWFGSVFSRDTWISHTRTKAAHIPDTGQLHGAFPDSFPPFFSRAPVAVLPLSENLNYQQASPQRQPTYNAARIHAQHVSIHQIHSMYLKTWRAAANIFTDLAVRPNEIHNMWGAGFFQVRVPAIIDMEGRMVNEIKCLYAAHCWVPATVSLRTHFTQHLAGLSEVSIVGSYPACVPKRGFFPRNTHYTCQRSKHGRALFHAP